MAPSSKVGGTNVRTLALGQAIHQPRLWIGVSHAALGYPVVIILREKDGQEKRISVCGVPRKKAEISTVPLPAPAPFMADCEV
jgi:hypothetical protein